MVIVSSTIGSEEMNLNGNRQTPPVAALTHNSTSCLKINTGDIRLYTEKQAIANLAKGQAIARQVKGLVIALAIAQKYTFCFD